MWDEWYAAFADGRWGWLAEAQGRFYMTFQIAARLRARSRPSNRSQPGQPVVRHPHADAARRRREGRGALCSPPRARSPTGSRPDETYRYADLSGAGGVFATLDYGDAAAARLRRARGHARPRSGIAATEPHARARGARGHGGAAQCPQCGGPLELRAPDKAERVDLPELRLAPRRQQGRAALPQDARSSSATSRTSRSARSRSSRDSSSRSSAL